MWDPFKDFDSIFKQMALSQGGSGFFSSTAKGSWVPLMDLQESERGYSVTADLPGVKKEDVEVVYDSGRLCISGDRPRLLTDAKSNDTWTILAERGFGRFERCLQLPQRIQEDTIRATFLEGVLGVTMEKSDPKPSGRSGSRINVS